MTRTVCQESCQKCQPANSVPTNFVAAGLANVATLPAFLHRPVTGKQTEAEMNAPYKYSFLARCCFTACSARVRQHQRQSPCWPGAHICHLQAQRPHNWSMSLPTWMRRPRSVEPRFSNLYCIITIVLSLCLGPHAPFLIYIHSGNVNYLLRYFSFWPTSDSTSSFENFMPSGQYYTQKVLNKFWVTMVLVATHPQNLGWRYKPPNSGTAL